MNVYESLTVRSVFLYLINETRLMEQFITLVKINSVTKEEREIASYLKALFQSFHVHVIEDDTAKRTGHGAGNIICTIEENTPGVTPIYFTAHMDTVKHGVNVNPHVNELGYIVTDGTSILGADDKAGIAVLIETLLYLQEHQMKHGKIQFVFTVGEEAGLVGAQALKARLIEAKYGYALDADGHIGTIIHKASYVTQLSIIMQATDNHLNDNTNEKTMIQLVTKGIAQLKRKQALFKTNVTVQHFQGNSATNDNSEYVEMFIKLRAFEEKNLKQMAHQIKQTFEQIAVNAGAQTKVTIQKAFPGFTLQASNAVVQTAIVAAKKIDVPVKMKTTVHSSDANIFNNKGIPTVNLGIGYEFIHTTKERIHQSSLVDLTKYVLSIIETVTNAK